MTNRAGCGVPVDYSWKRIDYAWSKNIEPTSMTRFAVATPGDGAPSDHYGIIVEYPRPGSSPVADLTAPTVALTSPAANATVAGSVDVAMAANDDRSVARVDLLLDGATIGSANMSPYQVSRRHSHVIAGRPACGPPECLCDRSDESVRAREFLELAARQETRTASASAALDDAPGFSPRKSAVHVLTSSIQKTAMRVRQMETKAIDAATAANWSEQPTTVFGRAIATPAARRI